MQVSRGRKEKGHQISQFRFHSLSPSGLVIDGSIAYNFNDGARALLEVYPEDSLLTIDMDD